MKKQDYTNEVLNYILDCKYDDFVENPSKNHVYFKALAASKGEKTANKLLKEILDEYKNDCGDDFEVEKEVKEFIKDES